MRFVCLAVFASDPSSPIMAPQVVIAEAMASNRRTVLDEEGDAADWVELSNLSDEPASLDGWHLTDDPARPARWTIRGLVLPPRGRRVIFCSGKDRQAALDTIVPPRSPNEVPDLTIWLEAGTIDPGDPTMTVTRGEQHFVKRWASRAAVPLEVGQPSAAAQPEWQPAAVGGRPAVRFLHSLSGLVSSPIPGAVLAASQECTLLVVQKYESPRHFSSTVLWQSSPTNLFNLHASWGNGNMYFDLGSPELGGRLNYPAPDHFEDEWVVISATWHREQIAELHLNGRLYVSQPVRGRFDAGGQAPLRIGVFGFTGGIAELLVFNRALQTQERSAVEAYLGQKYGLPVARREWHTSFELRAAGEVVCLFTPEGRLADTLTLEAASADISQGRLLDSGVTGLFLRPTPGEANVGPVLVGQVPAPRLSRPSGFYPTPVALALTLDRPGPDTVVRYTLDGSDPSLDSPAWPGELRVEGSVRPPDRVMWIPTNPSEHVDVEGQPTMPAEQRDLFGWLRPLFSGTGPVVVSLRAFREGWLPSAKVVATYFVGADTFPPPSLPVITLAVEPRDLFDIEVGLYLPGAMYVPTTWSTLNWWGTGNYFQRGSASERLAHVSFFPNRAGPQLDQEAGLRIHGGATRALPMKSLSLHARKSLGREAFELPYLSAYPIAYDKLVLRNSGQDSVMSPTLLRQALAAVLVGKADATIARSRPCLVYCNGEHWGLHHLTEDYGDNYFAKWGVPVDQLDYLDDGRVLAGNATHYREMVDFVTSHSLSDPASYKHATKLVDPEALAEYIVAEVYTANADWPHGNLKCWRARPPQPGASANGLADGRWRWLPLDFDATFGLSGQAEDDTLGRLVDQQVGGMYLDVLVRALLESPEFRALLLNRFADRLNQHYAADTVLVAIQQLADQVRPTIADHAARWRRPASVEEWERNLEVVRSFAVRRPGYLRDQLVARFHLDGVVEVSVFIEPPNAGSVQLSTITIARERQPLPWRGRYFRQVPLPLEALPEPGYRFAGWHGLMKGTSAAERLVLSNDLAITATFEVDTESIRTFVPAPHPLASGPWVFCAWPPEAPAGTYPPHLRFLQVADKDPALTDWVDPQVPWSLSYVLTNRSRFVGMGDEGVGMINTGSTQPAVGAGYVGAVVLALDTRQVTNAWLSWTAATMSPSLRPHALRLQWRLGNSGPFRDWSQAATGEPIEYQADPAGASTLALGPYRLPDSALNRPYVQIRWAYYAIPTALDGPRPLVRWDDVVVSAARTPADYLVWLCHHLPAPLVNWSYADCAPEADADGDGAANIQEYLSHTDPGQPDSRPDWRIDSAGGLLRFFWPIDPGTSGVKYGLEQSEDLRVWQAADWGDAVSYVHDGLAWRLAARLDRDDSSDQARQRFYRVWVKPELQD